MMTSTRSAALAVTLAGLAFGLAGCGGGGAGGGMLGFSPATTAAVSPAAIPAFANDPQTRSTQVAWNAVRARKCSFILDEPALKASYLQWEGQLGATPDDLQRIASNYENAKIAVAQRVALKPATEYCDAATLKEIRAVMARYRVGDYSAEQIERPVVAAEQSSGPTQSATAALKSMSTD